MRVVAFLISFSMLGNSLASGQVVKDRLRKLNVFRDMPEVTVTVEHPPDLGLEVDSVVFAQPEGECGEEFLDQLMAGFVIRGVDVVDRANIDALLSEHEFTVSGVVNSEDALELGEVSGADALVITKVRQCRADELKMKSERHRTKNGTFISYEATTRAHFRGTVQVINLSTAKVYSAVSLDHPVQESNRDTDSVPPYPAKHRLLSAAMNAAVSRVNRLFFSWHSTRTLKYYDENQCNMRIAYRLMQAGEVRSALEQAQASVEMCDYQRVKKPKLVAKALYNLGVTQMLLERFGEARETLEESLRLHPNKATSEAMADLRQVESAAAAVQQAEAAGLMTPGTANDPPSGAAAVPDGADDLEAELAKLKRLFDKGLISKETYDERVDRLLDESS